MAYINGKEILFSPAVNYTDANPVIEAEASRARKELENIKALGVAETMQEDSAVAYRKTVPANALPYAEVKEIGGLTYTSKNIFNAMAVNKSNVVVTDNGANITVTGDPNGDYNATDFYFDAGVYCATYGGTGNIGFVDAPASFVQIVTGVPFTITEGMVGCLVFGTNGGTFTNLMIVKGETPSDFAPYIEGGIANAAASAVESVGINILDEDWEVGALGTRGEDNDYSADTIRSKNYIPIVGGAQYYYTSPDTLTLCYYDAAKKFIGIKYPNNTNGRKLTAPTNARFIRVCPYQYGKTYNNDICVNKSNTAIDGAYYPPIHNSLPIPAEVQALDGWGMGVDADNHNRIIWDVANGVEQYRREVQKITLKGTESVSYSNARFMFYGVVTDDAKGYTVPCVCNEYAYNKNVHADANREDGIILNGKSLFIRDARFTTAAYLKAFLAERYAAGNPVVIVYALAEPIVTDLQEVLLDDNFIAVEGGGVITAVNANGFDVPTKIEYRLKG